MERGTFSQQYELESFLFNVDGIAATLGKCVRLLEGARVPYALIGALALARYTRRPRMTADIDLAVHQENCAGLDEILGAGFQIDRLRKSPLVLTDQDTGVVVKIMSGSEPAIGRALADAKEVVSLQQKVMVTSPEALLWLYLTFANGQSQCDAVEMIRSSSVDVARLEALFAAAGDVGSKERLGAVVVEAGKSVKTWSETQREKASRRGSAGGDSSATSSGRVHNKRVQRTPTGRDKT